MSDNGRPVVLVVDDVPRVVALAAPVAARARFRVVAPGDGRASP